MLSAKNKKTFTLIGAIFGLIVLVAAIWRAKKKADALPETKLPENIKEEIKQITMFCLGWIAFFGLVGLMVFAPQSADGFNHAQIIGVVGSGVGVVTNLPTQNYVPQFLYFEIATVPQQIKVNVNGDGLILDLDAAGLSAMRNIRSNGSPTNGYLLQLGNGLVKNKNLDIQVTNGVAAAFTVYAINGNEVVDRPVYMVTTGITINASQSFDLSQFTYSAIPSMAASDILNLIGNKRTLGGRVTGGRFSTKQELETLRGLLQLTENNSTASKIAIDNYDGTWQGLNFTPNAQQRIYVQRPIEVGKFSPSLLG